MVLHRLHRKHSLPHILTGYLASPAACIGVEVNSCVPYAGRLLLSEGLRCGASSVRRTKDLIEI